jgi:hypothetical protein
MKERSINSLNSIKEKRTLPFEILCKKNNWKKLIW